jgi:hypothetical protein
MHPGLANVNQARLNALQQSNSGLLSMMGLGANGMNQANAHLVPGLLRNPNAMFDPSMNEQVSARRSNAAPALTHHLTGG